MDEGRCVQAILDNLYDGVYIVNPSHRITHWNPAAARLTGYQINDVLALNCKDGILEHVDGNGARLCETACPLTKTLEDGQLRESKVYLHHKDGHRVPVLVRVAPICDEQGRITGAFQVFCADAKVMAALERAESLEKLMLLDALTGLPNRRHLEMSLAARLDEMERFGWPVGVLFADIDHFKRVNDAYGHDVGDQVLQMVGRTLAGAARSYDVVGRWGGEEFVGIIAHVGPEELRAIAERQRALVEKAFRAVGADRLCVTVSVGAALATPDDTPERLIKAADDCMYRSKAAGRNRVTLRPPGDATA